MGLLLSALDIEKLEKVQFSTARIVTSLPIFFLHLENPYIQVGKLLNAAKIVTMFRIHDSGVPILLE